jgi:hypothetical protein
MAKKNHRPFEAKQNGYSNRKAYQLRKAKKNKKNVEKEVTNRNAQAAKLVSDLYQRNSWTSVRNFRERIMTVNFDTLEKIAEQGSIISMFVQHRKRQMEQFARVAIEYGERGFRVKPRLTTEGTEKQKQARCRELEDFIMNTGWEYDDDREDDFADFLEYLVRDLIIFDQNATEVQYTREGKVFAFWYVDPTTIKRVDRERSEYPQNVYFVQQVDKSVRGSGKITAKYSPDQLIFDYSNKRSRLRHRGYGYSLIEMCVDVITTFLFAQAYNKDLFTKEKIPKGFLKVMGDVDTQTLNKVRDAWVSEMSGYGAKFAVPIIPSGKDGAGLDWQSLGQSNRDMEYHKLIMLIMSIIGGVFGIDLAELGIKTDNSTALIGESGDARIHHSKDAGLGSILSYIERYVNKILRKVDQGYVLNFVGIKDQDAKAAAETAKTELETFRTINEIRLDRGLDEIKEDYANKVLNIQAVQLIQAEAMAGEGEETEGMPGEAGAEGPEGPEGDEDYGVDEGDEGEPEEGEPEIDYTKSPMEKAVPSAPTAKRKHFIHIEV